MPRRGVTEQLRSEPVLPPHERRLPKGRQEKRCSTGGDSMNEFDDWNQTDIFVRHMLMTQPELIFSATPRTGGKAVGDAPLGATLPSESLECAAAIGTQR